MALWVKEIIPPELMQPAAALEFARWLRGLELHEDDKKQIVIAWCDHVGVPLSGDLVLRAGAR